MQTRAEFMCVCVLKRLISRFQVKPTFHSDQFNGAECHNQYIFHLTHARHGTGTRTPATAARSFIVK